MSEEHNTHFYSIEEIKRTLEATKEFEDGEQIYYFIGALRYLYDELNKQKAVLDKIKEYMTSYESINTIQECETPKNNIGLDEETFVEMVNRYMKVHDKILELLEEIE